MLIVKINEKQNSKFPLLHRIAQIKLPLIFYLNKKEMRKL